MKTVVYSRSSSALEHDASCADQERQVVHGLKLMDTGRTGWESVFECLIEHRACYAYLRGRREVEDE